MRLFTFYAVTLALILCQAFLLESQQCLEITEKKEADKVSPQDHPFSFQPLSLKKIILRHLLKRIEEGQSESTQLDSKSKVLQQQLVAEFIKKNAYIFFKIFRGGTSIYANPFDLPPPETIKTSPDQRYLITSSNLKTTIYELTENGPERKWELDGLPETITYDGRYLMLFRPPANHASGSVRYCTEKESFVFDGDDVTIQDLPCEPHEGLEIIPLNNIGDTFTKEADGTINWKSHIIHCQPIIDLFCLATGSYVTHNEKFCRNKFIVLNPNNAVFSQDYYMAPKECSEEESKSLLNNQIKELMSKSDPESYIFHVDQENAFELKHESSLNEEATVHPPAFALFARGSHERRSLSSDIEAFLQNRELTLSFEDALKNKENGIFVEKITNPSLATLTPDGRYVVMQDSFCHFAVLDLLGTVENFCKIYSAPGQIDKIVINKEGTMALIVSGVCASNSMREGDWLSSNDGQEKETMVYLFDLTTKDFFVLRKWGPIRYIGFSKEGNIFIWSDTFDVINVASLSNLITLKQAQQIIEWYKKTNPPHNTKLPEKDYEDFESKHLEYECNVSGDLYYYFDNRCIERQDNPGQ